MVVESNALSEVVWVGLAHIVAGFKRRLTSPDLQDQKRLHQNKNEALTLGVKLLWPTSGEIREQDNEPLKESSSQTEIRKVALYCPKL